ncbi:unnamed protein product [Rhizophagus irregularis]|uniref:DUF7431 domain-containing protein n=1 Tax=Rhizophagus irregularis TaxID=588596 RepID=A0A2I1H6J6_9GLOM|nr:hypothetical protein RhiirA4_548240 [Rhizophagus irregularis]CAB4422107.1 unnamed protein product [Rhizophagus irregularis]
MTFVIIKTEDDSNSKFYPLDLKKTLLDIRKKLETDKIINDELLFSKKIDDEFCEIVLESEKGFLLEHIVDVTNDNSKCILYLRKKKSSLDWNILNNKYNLDYGCIMSFDGNKRVNKKAFKMKNCELIYIGDKGYKKDKIGFISKEDWMKKTNLFINDDDDINIDILNFVKVGFSYSQNENFNEEIKSVYKYLEVGKVLLRFHEHLEPTEEFIKAVDNAAISENPREEFKKIIEEYGQFIPTEVILGGRVYFKDVKKSSENSASREVSANINKILEGNYSSTKKISKFYNFNFIKLLGGKHPDGKNFDDAAEKDWIESLKDYQNWECIEYRNPISIFQFISNDLRKKSFMSIGKKILYTGTEDCDYDLCMPGMYRNIGLNDMSSCITRIIQKNKDADCDIFATVIDTEDSKNVFFNCQIYYNAKGVPSIIIHGIQKEFHSYKYKLKVGVMIIGYDIDFSFILSDTRVELIKEECYSQNQYSKKLYLEYDLYDLIAKKNSFFGIPVLSDLNFSKHSFTIGHNFCNTQLDIEDEEEEEDIEEGKGRGKGGRGRGRGKGRGRGRGRGRGKGRGKEGRMMEIDRDSKSTINIFSYCSKTNCYIKLPKFTFYTFIILNNLSYSNFKLFSFDNKFNILGNKLFIDLKKKFTSRSISSLNSLNPRCVSLYLSEDKSYNPIFLNQNSEQIYIEYVECKCDKTCSICKDRTLRISEKDNAICIIYPLSISDK